MQSTHDQQTDNIQVTTYKNIRNKEIKKNISSTSARAREVESFGWERRERKPTKESKERKFPGAFGAGRALAWSYRKKVLFARVELVKCRLEDFDLDMICRGKTTHTDIQDYKSHFVDWLYKNNSATSKSNNQYGVSKQDKQTGSRFVPKSSEEKSIPNLSKLPIDEDLCKRGLQCAFEKVVESGFHHYIRNEQQSKQLEAVANWLVSPEKKWGLLLNGIPGNGKTTTLMAIRKVINALELEDPNPISENKVLGFRCQTAKELCEIATKDKTAFKQYKNSTILGIDEFGLEPTVVSSYGNEYTPVSDILAYRYEARLPTIMTTTLQMWKFALSMETE